jgi:hypothetical protein
MLVVLGVVLALAGAVFALQGMGIVGPSQSFMFQNPSWTDQGVVVTVVGLVTLAGGVWVSRRGTG